MTRRRGLLWLIQIILLGVVAWGIYRALGTELSRIDVHDFLRWRPSPGLLLISIVLVNLVLLMHAFLWRQIVVDLDAGRASPRDTVRIYFVSSLGRYIPGKLWQLAGFALMSKQAGLAAAPATASAIVGQFIFLNTGLLFVAVMLPEWAGSTPALVATAVLVIAAIALWVVGATPVGHGAREWLGRRLGGTLGERFTGALSYADRIRPRVALRWTAGYIVSWIVLGIAFVAFTTAFVPTASHDARFVAGTVAASYLAGYLILVAPAGVGVRESAMLVLLQQVPDVPIAAGLMVAVASRVWFTIAELLPLALIPLFPNGSAQDGENVLEVL